MALLLDLANIVGGFLLAAVLLRELPRVGEGLGGLAGSLAALRLLVGVLALVAAGYWVILHLVSGPRLFHFEVVGLGVGVALLWDRLTGRERAAEASPASPASGAALLLAVFGLIAIAVGIQGLFTPNS